MTEDEGEDVNVVVTCQQRPDVSATFNQRNAHTVMSVVTGCTCLVTPFGRTKV